MSARAGAWRLASCASRQAWGRSAATAHGAAGAGHGAGKRRSCLRRGDVIGHDAGHDHQMVRALRQLPAQLASLAHQRAECVRQIIPLPVHAQQRVGPLIAITVDQGIEQRAERGYAQVEGDPGSRPPRRRGPGRHRRRSTHGKWEHRRRGAEPGTRASRAPPAGRADAPTAPAEVRRAGGAA